MNKRNETAMTAANHVAGRIGRPSASRPRNEILLSPPEARLSYIDTLRLTVRESIHPTLFDLLIKAGGAPGTKRPKPIIRDFRTAAGEKLKLVTLHQPCFTIFEVLSRARDAHPFERGFEFSRVDIALDLIAKDRASAHELRTYLFSRLVPRKLRPRDSWLARDANGCAELSERERRTGADAANFTAYLGTRGSRGQVISTYAHQLTKTRTKEPCTRLEWRFRGAQAVASAGLSELENLAELDYYAFWDQRLRLLLPSAGQRLSELKSQISHRWMLPSRENALWDDTWSLLHQSGREMISAIKAKKCRLPELADAANGLL